MQSTGLLTKRRGPPCVLSACPTGYEGSWKAAESVTRTSGGFQRQCDLRHLRVLQNQPGFIGNSLALSEFIKIILVAPPSNLNWLLPTYLSLKWVMGGR